MNFECLKNIVGIIDTDCECMISELTTDEIDALKQSKSGLYTDNLEGGIHLKALSNIDNCKVFAEIALEARDTAIRRLQDDFILEINSRYKKNKSSYIGKMGNISNRKPLSVNTIFAGIKIEPNDTKDGILRIKGGELSVTASAPINLYIIQVPYGGNSGEILHTIPLTTLAGGRTRITLNNPIDLPLYSHGQYLEYYIVYDRTLLNGGQPMNNSTSCGCASERVMNEFVTLSGVNTNSIEDLSNTIYTNYTNGLVLDVEIKCDNSMFVCREYKENDAVSITMAYAVLYKTGELLIEAVMKSPEVSREILVNREYLWGKRNHFRKEYLDRIKYLGSDGVVDIYASDCFICNSDNGFMGTIFK